MPTPAIDLSPALENLNERERILVEARLKQCTIAQCAVMAGIDRAAAQIMLNEPRLKAALEIGANICTAHSAVTRERLSNMLLEAYGSADNATEMVLAVRELAKLHGLNAPTQVQIDHNVKLKAVKSEADIRQLTLEELERLALLRAGEVLEGEFRELPALEHARRANEH